MLKLHSSIGSVSTMADGGNKIVLYTQELPEDHMAELFRLKKDGLAIVAIQPIARTAPELEPILEEPPEGKTPSQRLRNVLFVYYRNVLNKRDGFNTFYADWIERKINEIKDQLPSE